MAAAPDATVLAAETAHVLQLPPPGAVPPVTALPPQAHAAGPGCVFTTLSAPVGFVGSFRFSARARPSQMLGTGGAMETAGLATVCCAARASL